MMDEILKNLKQECDRTIDALSKELSKVRTGRANLAILDDVKVNYYGTLTPLNKIASLGIADPKLIVIKPWDKSVIPDIEKGINQAGLGLTPVADGALIRLPIPPLTDERRKSLLRIVKQKGEDAKVSIRNHRRDANEMLKEAEKEKQVSEDDLHKGLDKVQEDADKFIKKVDEVLQKKEKEITEI